MKQQRYFPAFDGLRGIGILAVMFSHGVDSILRSGWISDNLIFYMFKKRADLAIEMFFLLSGFLVTQKLMQEQEKYGFFSVKKFYLRRIVRLMPVLWVYLPVIALFSQLDWIENSMEGVWASLFYVRNYWPAKDWYTGHFWSLSIEEHFYLFWPMLLIFCLKLKKPYIGVLISIGIFMLWRVLYYDLRIFFFVIPGVKAIFRTDIRVSTILLGCFLAILYQSEDFRSWLKNTLSWPLYLVCVFAAIATTGIHYLWIILMVALVPFVFYPMLNPDSVAGKILETRWLKWFGSMCYSLYIWQQLFLVQGLKVQESSLLWFQRFPQNFIFAFIVGILSYYFIEEYFRKKGYSWIQKLK
jgi:peptidoglycan/LPS O-acetylase OafA/YrhL